MAKHFQRELKRIKRLILSLGAMVETCVRDTREAIESIDFVLRPIYFY